MIIHGKEFVGLVVKFGSDESEAIAVQSIQASGEKDWYPKDNYS